MRLILLFVCLPILSVGQITLTSNDFADGGDTIRMSIANDSEGIDFSLTGSDYTWDFSTLTVSSQTLKNFQSIDQAFPASNSIFGESAPSNYQATNFTDNTGDIPWAQLYDEWSTYIHNGRVFSKNSSDSISTIGYHLAVNGVSHAIRSDTIETRYKFPLNFGNTYSSKGYTNLEFIYYLSGYPDLHAIWRQHRLRNSNVDGWGTITTPYGTFEALRISHQITEKDSIMSEEPDGTLTWTELPVSNSTIYEWWTTDKLEPVLRVHISDALGSQTVSLVEFLDNFNFSVAVTETVQTSIRLSPNPTTDKLFINNTTRGSKYSIIDRNGKIVKSGILNSTSSSLDVDYLSNGTYQLIIRSPEATRIGRFIKL